MAGPKHQKKAGHVAWRGREVVEVGGGVEGGGRASFYLDVPREVLVHLGGAVACDENETALNLVGVEDLDQFLDLVILHRRPNLAPDRVLDPAEVLHMRPQELAGTCEETHTHTQTSTCAGDSKKTDQKKARGTLTRTLGT